MGHKPERGYWRPNFTLQVHRAAGDKKKAGGKNKE